MKKIRVSEYWETVIVNKIAVQIIDDENDDDVKESPLMKQYNSIKEKHSDAILLFEVGDFYETMKEDAVIISNVLGIVLTNKKNKDGSTIDLAGFPSYSLNNYLPKLVRARHKVAICKNIK